MIKQYRDCPFCGKQPTLYEVFGSLVIGCTNKRCPTKPCTWLQNPDIKNIDKISKIWNKRA